MSEELRILLRNATYLASAVVVYWFVSYEWAGTIMMLVLVVAALGFVVIASRLIKGVAGADPHGGDEASGRQRLLSLPTRVFGFDEPDAGPGDKAPLEIAEGEMPHGSVWPLVSVVGLVTCCIGFIFGTWFYVIGVGLGLWGMWGWVSQLIPPSPGVDPEDPAGP